MLANSWKWFTEPISIDWPRWWYIAVIVALVIESFSTIMDLVNYAS